jgi:hypothetical protein
MLYVRRNGHTEICVLQVSLDVLDLPGAIVTDMNAARTYARFKPAPEGLEIVDRALTFARYWTHPDPDEQYRRKGLKRAEVLVPRLVPSEFIVGAYVSGDVSRGALADIAADLPATVNSDLFFV